MEEGYLYNINIFEVTREKRHLIDEYNRVVTKHNLVLDTSHRIKYFNKYNMIKIMKDIFKIVEKEKIDVKSKEFKVYLYDTEKVDVPIVYRLVFDNLGDLITCSLLYYDCDKPFNAI